MKIRLQNLRLSRPLISLDTETTGIDTNTSRVIEIAAIRLDPVAKPVAFHRLLNPGVPIPASATHVHGLVDADVRGKPRFAEIAHDLNQFLNGSDLVAYNAAFDLAMLAAEFARCGMKLKVKGRSVLDPHAIFRREEPRSLCHAVRFYLGQEGFSPHSASSDALATLRVLDAQVGRYELPTNPEALHKLLVTVDIAGKFTRDANGAVIVNFGKHRGRPLADVASDDADYLRWALANMPLLDDSRELIHRALAGKPLTSL
jgi:DNA polymerase-3 subunit epsilon